MDQAGFTEVTVTPADLHEVVFDGTAVVVTGTAGHTRVTFVGDHRPTRELLFTVAESGKPCTAYVEDWQITRVCPVADEAGGAR
jgi:hypothetical protein